MVGHSPAQLCGVRCAGLLGAFLTLACAANAQSLTGTVVDAYSGKPLPGATIFLVGTLHAAVAGPGGTFMIGPLPIGSYEVEASRYGYVSTRQRVALDRDQQVVLNVRLEPDYGDTSLPMPVGFLPRRAAAIPLDEALRVAPAVQLARRTVHDVAPVIRGMHGAQVAVEVDGMRSIAGSPFGPMLHAPLLPYELEIVTGPYALTWGGAALSAVRIRTPYQRVAAAASGFRTRPWAYDVAALFGRVQRSLAYEVTGHLGKTHGYTDRLGNQHLPGLTAGSIRGRARLRHRYAELAGWSSYRTRAAAPGTRITQTDSGARLMRRMHGSRMRSVELNAAWQQQDVAGWPLAASPDYVHRRLYANGRVNFVPIAGWTLAAGADWTGDRLGEWMLHHAGVYVYGAAEAGRVQYSGAIRGHGTRSSDGVQQSHMSAALGAVVRLNPDIRLSAMVGTAARPASVYERYGVDMPYIRMPLNFASQGNAALMAERSIQGDVGLHYASPRATRSATVFVRRMLRRIDVGALPWYVNAHATVLGVEAAVTQAVVGDFVHFAADAAYLIGQPRALTAVAPLGAGVGLRLTAPADLLAVALDIRGAAPAHFDVLGTRHRLPGYVVASTHMRVPLPQRHVLVVGIRNVTAARFAWHATGLVRGNQTLDEPGRQWFLQLSRGL